MPKLPLTAVILNHRSDARLEKCLASANFAAEILVLDSNSGVNWAKYPEVRVISLAEAISDFSAVRNQGLQLASQDWVLFLDSDEYLEPDSAVKIEAALSQENTNGYLLPRQDIFAGKRMKYGEVGGVKLLRLLRKNTAHFERKVHEIAVVSGTTKDLEVVIMHQAHMNVTEFLTKVNQYAILESLSRPQYSTAKLWLELVFFPPAKFVVNYFFKLGFLDGWQGLVYASCMSLHSLLVRVYLYEKQQTH